VEAIARSKIPFRGLTGFSGTLRVVWDTSKPNRQPRRTLRVDTTRAREHFGVEAQTPFEEGLRRMIEWQVQMRPA